MTSYRQTVRAYPRGGGSYIVSRENLGTVPGLIAAAAILTDYVLTVAVSVTAGTIAVASAFPVVDDQRVLLAAGTIVLLTLANLRGGRRRAPCSRSRPTASFFMVAATLVTGLVQCLTGCRTASSAELPLEALAPVSLFLVLRAFSSGATALTGVEAIADGVQAFRRPQAHNAATTLAIMGAVSTSMFLGITFLARRLDVRVAEHGESAQSVLAQIGATVFGEGVLFYTLQVFTAGILFLAANTAYQDFPRLSAILARDRFMPSQFRSRGDRLVFSNGVLVLAGLAIGLIYLFDANLNRLIQLYVVGVFTAFTLSQAGMVRRWLRTKDEGWRRSAVINGVGAATTGIVLVIVTVTKFRGGAWIVIVAIPVIVLFFLAVHRHYVRVALVLRRRGISVGAVATNTFLLLVPDLGEATAAAVGYLRAIRPTRLTPLFVGDHEAFEAVEEEWSMFAPRLGALQELQGAEHPSRSLRRYLRSIEREDDDFVTVVIPELLSPRSRMQFAGQRRALWLKARLFFEPGVVVTDVPVVTGEGPVPAPHGRPVEPARSVVLVPVSAMHDATVRALNYARSLHSTAMQALFFATDPEDVPRIVEDWAERRVDVPLAIVDASFRDLGEPLLAEVRRATSRGDTVVTVVLPEFVVHRWWEHLLHNQTGLYFKRLLLFEPDVIVTSVPFNVRAAERAAI